MTEPRITPDAQQLVPHSQRPIQRYPLNNTEYSTAEESAFSLRDFLNVLRRRRAIAINTFVLVVVLGIVLTLISTPQFSSSARMLVEGKVQTFAVSDTKNPLGNLFLPSTGHDVATQVEILRSPVVMEKVYETTRIPPGSVSIAVAVVPQTDLIDITVTSTSKEYAQRFAKAIPEVYLEKVKGERVSEIEAALAFARSRFDDQELKVKQAEAALRKFEAQNGAISPGKGAQMLDEMGAALTAVRQSQSDLAAARGRVVALQNARGGVSDVLQTPVTMTNPEVGALKSRIAALQDQRAELLFLYQPGEDEVKKVDAQIKQLQSRLASTPATITNVSRAPNPEVGNLESQITEAQVAVKAAQGALSAAQARANQIEPEVTSATPLQRVSSRLQSDIVAARSGLSGVAQTMEELMMREQAAQAKNNPVSVISEAGPAQQISPRILRNILMSLFLGAILACGMALLQHSLDDHVNDEEEARSLLDIPVLGVLPLIASSDNKDSETLGMNGSQSGNPSLALASAEPRLIESFRMLRSNVYFALVNSDSRSILVTSTVPGEGKTTTVANLAMAMAMDGRRIILVDADMRRPTLDKFFNLPRQPGLSNILAGQTDWRDALQSTNVAGLRLITSGALPPNPAELLSSAALDQLLQELQEEADMVIFDTPPCPATADTQVLSAKVDGVIYVMHLGKVRKAGLQHSFDLLHQANARILGIVFNKFDSPQSNGYGYYYGYSQYGQYEADADEEDDSVTRSSSKKNGQSRRKRSSTEANSDVSVADSTIAGADNGAAKAAAASKIESGVGQEAFAQNPEELDNSQG